MTFKIKLLKALVVFLGAISPAIFIYILSFFITENAMVGSTDNFADTVFSFLSILSYTGPFALVIGFLAIAFGAQIFGSMFDIVYKNFSRRKKYNDRLTRTRYLPSSYGLTGRVPLSSSVQVWYFYGILMAKD